ncbi:hypothetical protein [Sediminibacterium soli]|uniref:hypothetical protein n=1 Tax=Sediminibacterium soli TaxID=2698829 RepID=UPI001379F9BC|nr:hypothetical protein [Sediminibacterium soli]NCI47580.1 hypothetical protein [Sediminibacterium soli]
MKKIIVLIVLLVSVADYGLAAPVHLQPRRLESLKIAYITRELSLTPEESQKFWPVYNGYVAELRKTRLEKKEDVLEQEESTLAVRKKYREEFRKILTTDQRANRALTAERDFNNMIRKELQKRIEMRKGNS